MDPRDESRREIGVSIRVIKVIEVLAESPESWEEATRTAVREAALSLHDITSIYIKDMQAVVREGQVTAWRVNAKVSFVLDDRHRRGVIPATIGGAAMRYRQQENVRDGNYRPSRDDASASPEYDDFGLHGEDRRQYRGRESYEQQTRGGQGGRSGMWDHRFVPRDLDEPYRNNADEDGRGYQNISRRQEFEGSNFGRDDDYSRTDYGSRPQRGMYYGEDRSRRGARGPKGYKRSDDRIREDICDRLSSRWDVDASDVEVSVASGEVTLSGMVSDREQKFRIEHIADGVAGVSDVHNQLRVRRETGALATPATQTSPNTRGNTNQTRSS